MTRLNLTMKYLISHARIIMVVVFMSHYAYAQTVNVKDAPYNAAGDGVTDDQAAIQSAIDANPGATILLENGTFLVGSMLLPDANITLLGSNASVLASLSLASELIRIAGDNVTIQGLEIDGNESAPRGIYDTTGYDGTIIDGVELHDFHGSATTPAHGIRMDDPTNATIRNTEIHTIHVHADQITGNSIGANRAIFINRPGTTLIENCTIRDIEGPEDSDGIQLLDPGTGTVTIRNNTFYHIGKRALKIQGPSNVVIEDNIYYSNGNTDFYAGPPPGTPAVPLPDSLPGSDTHNYHVFSVFAGQSNVVARNNIVIVRRNFTSYNGGGINGLIEDNYADIFGYPNTHAYTESDGSGPFNMYAYTMFSGDHANAVIQNNTFISANRGMLLGGGASVTVTGNKILARNTLIQGDNSGNATITGTVDLASRHGGYYRFNSVSGATVYNFPRGDFTGAIVSAVSTSLVDGPIGEALQLNNTNPYLDLSAPGMVLTAGKSLSLWVRPDVGPGDGSSDFYPGIFSDGASGSSDNFISFQRYQDSVARVAYYDNAGLKRSSLPFDYTQGQWMHIVISLSGTGSPAFYINGIAAGTAPSAGSVSLDYLGRGFSGSTGGGGAQGAFDEIILYNDTIDAAEVAEIFKRVNPTLIIAPANLLASQFVDDGSIDSISGLAGLSFIGAGSIEFASGLTGIEALPNGSIDSVSGLTSLGFIPNGTIDEILVQ